MLARETNQLRGRVLVVTLMLLILPGCNQSDPAAVPTLQLMAEKLERMAIMLEGARGCDDVKKVAIDSIAIMDEIVGNAQALVNRRSKLDPQGKEAVDGFFSAMKRWDLALSSAMIRCPDSVELLGVSMDKWDTWLTTLKGRD